MMLHFHTPESTPCDSCPSPTSFMSVYASDDKSLNLCKPCLLELVAKLKQAELKLAGRATAERRKATGEGATSPTVNPSFRLFWLSGVAVVARRLRPGA
jgi:hypothetical protein